MVAGYRLEVGGQTQNEKCKMKSAKCKVKNGITPGTGKGGDVA